MTEGRDSKLMQCLINLDIKGAFDSVSVRCLLNSLAQIPEIPDYVLALLKNWLEGRVFQVHYDGASSEPYQAFEGVPQGGCLSPMLWILFVRDLPSFLEENWKGAGGKDTLKRLLRAFHY